MMAISGSGSRKQIQKKTGGFQQWTPKNRPGRPVCQGGDWGGGGADGGEGEILSSQKRCGRISAPPKHRIFSRYYVLIGIRGNLPCFLAFDFLEISSFSVLFLVFLGISFRELLHRLRRFAPSNVGVLNWGYFCIFVLLTALFCGVSFGGISQTITSGIQKAYVILQMNTGLRMPKHNNQETTAIT